MILKKFTTKKLYYIKCLNLKPKLCHSVVNIMVPSLSCINIEFIFVACSIQVST